MKRLLVLLCLIGLWASAGADNRELVSLLTQMEEKCEVTPDSFFNYARRLKTEIGRQTDPAAKAVYQATLAHLLSANRHRSQAWRRQTASHPDSIQEWSRAEYSAHAKELYDLALADKELLHATPTKAWLPLVSQGKDEKVYGSSMLHVVWRAMCEDLGAEDTQAHVPQLTALYRRHGLREAEFRLKLDSIDQSVKWKEQPEAYRALLEEFRKLPCCDVTYERLANREEDVEKQWAMLHEGLKLYPKSTILKNAILQMESPILNFSLLNICYPESEEKTVFRIRDMKGVSQSTVSLRQESDKPSIQILSLPKKKILTHKSYEEREDTLVWKVPSLGEYKMVVEGKTKAKLTAKPKPQEATFYVSRLAMFRYTLPDNTQQFIVVDRQTGKPVEGAKVSLSRDDGRDGEMLVAELTTDARGVAECRDLITQKYKIKVWKGEDVFLPPSSLYLRTQRSGYAEAEQKPQKKNSLYTDRSIYRPGQTVHVGGLTFVQKGEECEVEKGTSHTLKYIDEDGKKIVEHEVMSDDFGILTDSLLLPENTRPGMYWIETEGSRTSFRVEEYRRPTFYVEMDEAPAVTMPLDTLFLTGRALTYSGVPLAGAKVSGEMSYLSFWGRFGMTDGSSAGNLDTIKTDTEGRFRMGVPLKCFEDELDKGTRVRVKVDVLSSMGETQQASITVPLSKEAFQLRANIPDMEEKDNLKPWEIEILSSTGKPVEGEVLCKLFRKGDKDKEPYSLTLPSGRNTMPWKLKELPSGAYEVRMQYVQNGDTAEWETRFTLFSMQDTRLASKASLHLYCPCDTFGVGRSAQLQIGTSLPEAWIYCCMTTEDKVLKDTIIHMADTAFVWNIDYKPEYKDGMHVSAAVYEHGTLNVRSLRIYRALTEKKLVMRWDTFRNQLHPGEQEEWKLTLLHKDGTPASANVLLSMYDASLDAISPHSISFSQSYNHRITNLRHTSWGAWANSKHYVRMDAWYHPLKEKSFSAFDQNYFAYSTGMVSMSDFGASPRQMKSARMLGYAQSNDDAIYEFREAPMAKSANEGALRGQIAGLEAGKNSNVDEAEEMQKLRGERGDSFTELAFFRPTLRTDKDGKASIAFTLPESLTSWHLTGFAHTRDLFTAKIDETITARKELMAELYLPRFLRQGDKGTFTASVRNVSGDRQEGKATCIVMDGKTEKVIARQNFSFALDADADTTFTMPIEGGGECSALLVKWMAEGKDFSDGEQRMVPVLTDMERVTETRAFFLNKTGTEKVSLTSLYAKNHPSAVNRGLTVEYTAHPMWLALKSLPSLFTPHCRNVLCQTSAYYATTLAQHVLRQMPDTEWLQDSLQYKPMLSLDNRMALLSGIAAMQGADGSISWFPGMNGNGYMTREVAYLLVRLQKMGVKEDAATICADDILRRAIGYLSEQAHLQVEKLKEKKDMTVGLPTLRYLYILASTNISLDKKTLDDAKYLMERLQKEDMKLRPEDAAIAAIVLKNANKEKEALGLMAEVEKRLRQADGCYVSYPGGSFTTIDRKLQTHVQIMEAVREVIPAREDLLQGMTEWLLKQKRTQQWDEPCVTANAVYALVGQQVNESTSQRVKSDVITLRDRDNISKFVVPAVKEGYLKDSMEVKLPTELVVEKHGKGLSWGAVYATYEMPLDSVRADWQGFKVRRDIQQEPLNVGDRLHVRYTITADRDYDFVSLTLPRPAAAEPEEKLSGYHYQNGLGYYKSVLDSGSEYYMDSMPKGTYVLEEDWLISHGGSYSVSPAVIKCLYAPEFQSHTPGIRVEISQK